MHRRGVVAPRQEHDELEPEGGRHCLETTRLDAALQHHDGLIVVAIVGLRFHHWQRSDRQRSVLQLLPVHHSSRAVSILRRETGRHREQRPGCATTRGRVLREGVSSRGWQTVGRVGGRLVAGDGGTDCTLSVRDAMNRIDRVGATRDVWLVATGGTGETDRRRERLCVGRRQIGRRRGGGLTVLLFERDRRERQGLPRRMGWWR